MAFQQIQSPSFAISSGWVNPPGGAFDGDYASNWATARVSGEGISGNDYIGQDFGESKSVREITLQQLSVATAVSSVRVQYSDNLTSWTDEGTHAVPKDGGVNTIPVAGVGAHRAWRLLANANPGGNERWQVRDITMSVEDVVQQPTDPLPGPPSSQWFGPCVSAYMVGNQPFSPGQYPKIGFDHATYDTDGCFDVPNSRFVCRLAGIYSVKLSVAFAGNIPAGLTQQVQLTLPSPGDPTKQYYQVVAPQSGPGTLTLKTDMFLNLGDVLEARGYVSGGSSLSFTGQSCEFVVSYIRPCSNCGQT